MRAPSLLVMYSVRWWWCIPNTKVYKSIKSNLCFQETKKAMLRPTDFKKKTSTVHFLVLKKSFYAVIFSAFFLMDSYQVSISYIGETTWICTVEQKAENEWYTIDILIVLFCPLTAGEKTMNAIDSQPSFEILLAYFSRVYQLWVKCK